jgi:hypothetical protein
MMKVIGVLGCGRSGTSLTAQTLKQSGVNIGKHTKITYENTLARRINDKFLADNYDANISSLNFYGSLPSYEIRVPSSTKQEMKKTISHFRGLSGNFFAYKDPRLVVLHDGWVSDTDIIISIYRNPLEVCASLMKMFARHINDDNREVARKKMIDYWLRFNQSLLYVYEKYDKPNYIVRFDETYNEQMKRVFNEIGIGNYQEVYKPSSVSNKNNSIPEECQQMWNDLEELRSNQEFVY